MTSSPDISENGGAQILVRATAVADAAREVATVGVVGGVLENVTDLLYKEKQKHGSAMRQ